MVMRQVFVPMTHDQLAALLTELAAEVHAHDSFEGHLEYALPDPDQDPRDADVMVRAGYRVGNRMGQGGFRMIGHLAEVPDPPCGCHCHQSSR
jgi:hypothetical protein